MGRVGEKVWKRGTNSHRGELYWPVSLALACLMIPPLFGELFPFTVSPMFRDAPSVYCVYEVSSPDGQKLDNQDFGLQRNYDGNPVGLGAGRRPPTSVDRFGEVATVDEIREQVGLSLRARKDGWDFVDVTQTVIARVGSTVGPSTTTKVRVHKSEPF